MGRNIVAWKAPPEMRSGASSSFGKSKIKNYSTEYLIVSFPGFLEDSHSSTNTTLKDFVHKLNCLK